MATTQQDLAWYDLVGRFRRKAAEFERIFNKLVNDRDFVSRRPALKADYDRLLSAGRLLQAKIVSARNKINSALAWLKGLVGLDGLGFLPLLPIALVSASNVAIGKWVSDAYMMSKRIDETRRLEAKGYSPSRADALATRSTSTAGGGIIGGALGLNPKWLIAGAVLIVVAPPLFKMLGSRKRGS